MQKRAFPLIMAAVTLLGLSACSDANKSAAGGEVPAGMVECSYPSEGSPARAVDPPAATAPKEGVVTVTLKLTAGEIPITMDRAKAPCTVNSFVSLAEQGYFDDTVCHRLTDYGIFVLQCGDPSATGTGGPGYTIPDEVDPSLTYPAGTVAMANRGSKDTGGSQFFLVYADSQLDPDYTVFGTMDQAGIDVVGGIASQGVDAGDKTSPIAEAKIESVSLG
ncbi:peptidylprolyl isomerase [Tessaracoccus aquimaris]|nr:peptidylprolyl isomerase [Tessaracoccus aquimaris]